MNVNIIKVKFCRLIFQAKNLVKALLVLGASALLGSGFANAATVTGTLSFVVAFEQVMSGGSAIGVDFGDFPLASGIDADGIFDLDISNATISAVAGDFLTAGLSAGSIMSLKDFRYDLVGVPNPIATTGTFEFSMLSLTPPAIVSGPGGGDFIGAGILQDSSGFYDDTAVDWTFNNVTGQIAIVAIGAAGVAVVPLPGSLIFMFSALGGLLLAKRKSAA